MSRSRVFNPSKWIRSEMDVQTGRILGAEGRNVRLGKSGETCWDETLGYAA